MRCPVRLTRDWIRWRGEGSITHSEAHEFIVLSWVTVLARSKFVQCRKCRHVGVVIHDGVRLLDDDDVGVRAR